jgi:hypothetical protein
MPVKRPGATRAPKLVRHDAKTVVVGGFASLEIVRWEDPVGILSCSVLGVTGVLELGKKPTVRPLVADWAQSASRGRDGRWVIVLGLQKKQRFVGIFPANLDPKKAKYLDFGRKVLEFATAGFTGDRVIALPGALGIHRRYSYNFVCPQLPYVEDGAKLVPVDGVEPGDEGGADDLHGVVACAGGRDLVVWGGRIFELRDDKLQRATGFDLERNFNNFGLTTAPSRTGFFTISGGRLVEVVPGASAARVVIDDKWFRIVRPGPAGTLILEAGHDTAKESALWSYDPKRDAIAKVSSPPGVYSMTVFYSAARKALLMQEAQGGGTAGQVLRSR